jgi:hypothetical protein
MKRQGVPLACFFLFAWVAMPLLATPKEAKKPDFKGFSEQVTKLIADWRVPGQPEYGLVPYKGTEFNLKGLTGVSLEFNLDETGKAVAATFKQPGATTVFKRK